MLKHLQGSLQLYVRVTDIDRWPNRNDRVDDIYVPIIIGSDQSITRTYKGKYGNGRLKLSFHLYCLNDFFGENCSTYCHPINIANGGHFYCGENGERICLPGWQDPGNHCLTRNKLHAH